MHYVFLDEIQKVDAVQNPYVNNSSSRVGFVDVLLEVMKIKNVDLYVIGSNSYMLSSDILTDFRGRGDEIRVLPLTYKEFFNAYSEDKRFAWRDFLLTEGFRLLLF